MKNITEKMLSNSIGNKPESLGHNIEVYADIIKNMPGLVVLANNKLEIELCSDALLEFSGWSFSEVQGKHPIEFVPEKYRQSTTAKLVEVLQRGEAYIETWILTKSGVEVPFAISGKRIQIDNKPFALGIGVDLTRRLATEKELRFANSLLKSQNEVTMDGILTVDRHGKVLFNNKRFLEIWSIPQELADSRDDAKMLKFIRPQLVSPGDFMERVQYLYRQQSETARDVLELKDGRFIDRYSAPLKDENGGYLARIWYFRDVTSFIRQEREQLRISKLEAISTLAAGIAHDFNNILTSVIGNINMASMYAGHEEPAGNFLKSAEQAALKAKDLTYKLLTFSEGGVPVKKVTDIKRFFEDTVQFILSGRPVDYNISFDDDLWNAEFDTAQITQVIQNIVLNAIDAMSEGGTITITGTNFLHDGSTVPALGPGKFLKISIADNGTGITEENIHRIFDPYFTTSPLDNNKGKGLGLSIVYSIIFKHGGTVEVESKPEMGACFTFYLPAVDGIEDRSEVTELVSETKTRPRILVMDDDPMVRQLASEMLETCGYDVETAANGAETLKKYGDALKTEKPFHGVIIDLTIRGDKSGKEIFEKLKKIDPGVKALISSGYTTNDVMKNFEKYGFMGVLHKPYGIDEMSKAVATMLS